MRKYKEEYESTKNQLVTSKKSVENASVSSVSKKTELEELTKQAADIDKTLTSMKGGNEDAISSTRVKDVMSSIYAVAEKRRSIVNE